jgi:hypothetical protein
MVTELHHQQKKQSSSYYYYYLFGTFLQFIVQTLSKVITKSIILLFQYIPPWAPQPILSASQWLPFTPSSVSPSPYPCATFGGPTLPALLIGEFYLDVVAVACRQASEKQCPFSHGINPQNLIYLIHLNNLLLHRTVSGDDGQWFARGLGVWMTAVTLSPWWMGMPKELLAKLYLPVNAIFMGMFIHASFFLETTGPPESNILPINMWWTQLPIAAFILFTNIQAVGEIESKSKKN